MSDIYRPPPPPTNAVTAELDDIHSISTDLVMHTESVHFGYKAECSEAVDMLLIKGDFFIGRKFNVTLECVSSG